MSFADTPTLLIKNARIDGHSVDLRINHTVQAMARHLEVVPNETVLDARGGELLPACTIITYICLLPLRPTIPLIATSGQEHSVSAERC